MKRELIQWRRRTGPWLAIFFFGSACGVAGCGSAPCETTKTCPATASGGGSTATTASGMGGAGGGVPAGCVPKDEFDASGGAVADDCGIFVSSSLGDDSGDGSQAKPFGTFKAAALEAEATGKPIYACAETFTDQVRGNGNLNFFGGLDCTKDWVWQSAEKTRIEGEADAVVFSIDGAGTARVADVIVVAADAMAAGGSSIAMLVNEATASLERVELFAGNGAKGDDGAAASGVAEKGTNGGDGNWVLNKTCGSANMMGYLGGSGATGASCASGGMSHGGGLGGTGTNASSGGPGALGDVKDMGGGDAGTAQDSNSPCNSGGNGANGDTGADGDGATGQGTLTSDGYQGVVGVDGGVGTHGHGGGGGGGAKECLATSGRAGPSGGGGGSGGCGGVGGKGGGAGGSSIGLVSIDATLTFDGLVVTTADGGAGGDGEGGQAGGNGGLGGNVPITSACSGGGGGKGGLGGRGGGGLGGHSIGIAHVGAAPSTTATVTLGDAADGGQGTGTAGAAGQAAQVLSFMSM